MEQTVNPFAGGNMQAIWSGIPPNFIGSDGCLVTDSTTGNIYQKQGPVWTLTYTNSVGFNFSTANLTKWRAGLARVRSGKGNAKIAVIGDSTTVGAGSGVSGTGELVGAFPNSYPNALVALLNAAGVTASNNSIFGEEYVSLRGGTSYPLYDTRVTLGTGWTATGSTGFGGCAFAFTGATPGTWSFAPAGAIDTIVVQYISLPGHGSMTVNVDGGASLGTVNTNAASGVANQTFTVTKGVHTINFVAAGNGSIQFTSVIAYDSTKSQVLICQGGIYGSTTNDWITATSPWSPFFASTNIAADLSIICLTINDSNNGTLPATYQAQLQAIITQAMLSGDVILMTGVPSNTVQATNGTLAQFVAINYTLARQLNIPLIDLTARWGSYASSSLLGYYGDILHPSAMGYQDVAQGVASKLLSV